MKRPPIPPPWRKYPWATLRRKGDTFFAPGMTRLTRAGVYAAAKRMGAKLTARPAVESGVAGYRIWRL